VDFCAFPLDLSLCPWASSKTASCVAISFSVLSAWQLLTSLNVLRLKNMHKHLRMIFNTKCRKKKQLYRAWLIFLEQVFEKDFGFGDFFHRSVVVKLQCYGSIVTVAVQGV